MFQARFRHCPLVEHGALGSSKPVMVRATQIHQGPALLRHDSMHLDGILHLDVQGVWPSTWHWPGMQECRPDICEPETSSGALP